MKSVYVYARVLAALALLMLALAPGLPAAGADDAQPPAAASSDKGTPPTPPPASTPDANPPVAPAGAVVPAPPPGCSASSAGYSVFSPPGVQAIPDYDNVTHKPGIITSTITVASANTYLWDVNVTVHIKHTFPGDLDIHLISPAGTVIVLSDRNGGGNPGNVFSGTTWDDQAGLINGSGLPVTDYVFTPGTAAARLNPQAPLGALLGQTPNGPWQLVVSDNAHVDTGELDSWSLDLVTLAGAPTVINTTSSTANYVSNMNDTDTVNHFLIFNNLYTPISAITLTAVITHDLPSTLDILLVSPAGVTITLSTGNGGGNHNVFAGTLWSDKAILTNPPNLVTEYSYVSGVVASPLAPEEALSELIGSVPNGYWKLAVQDAVSDGHSGQLGPVALFMQTATCRPELAASTSADAEHPRLGAPTAITLQSHNIGALATSVVLTGSLSPLLTFHSASGSGWLCLTPAPNAHGGNVVCTRPSQAANTYEDVVVSATMPLLPGHIPLTLTLSSAQADTYLPNNTDSTGVDAWAHSANGNPWDVDNGDGSMLDGGQDAFDGFGMLRVAVLSGNTTLQDVNPTGFNLASATGVRWNTTTPVSIDTVRVSRSLLAQPGVNWLRYVDSFNNTGGAPRTVIVDWGGNLGSDSNTVTAGTSSGDQTLAANDRWAVTIEQDVPNGPAVDAPVGYAFRAASDTSYQGPYDFDGFAIDSSPWPSTGNDLLGHQFKFTLQPGQTRRLAYFVYRGLSEYVEGPEDCGTYGGCATPALGSQVTLAKNVVAALAAAPPLSDLSPAERASLVNWPEHFTFLPAVLR